MNVRGLKPIEWVGSSRDDLEVVLHHDGNAYRAVYTVRFKAAVYVLHAFQKKAKKGIATPKHEMELVKRRLKAAEKHYGTAYGKA